MLNGIMLSAVAPCLGLLLEHKIMSDLQGLHLNIKQQA